MHSNIHFMFLMRCSRAWGEQQPQALTASIWKPKQSGQWGAFELLPELHGVRRLQWKGVAVCMLRSQVLIPSLLIIIEMSLVQKRCEYEVHYENTERLHVSRFITWAVSYITRILFFSTRFDSASQSSQSARSRSLSLATNRSATADCGRSSW